MEKLTFFLSEKMNKRSPYYVKSEFEKRAYGNEKYTTFERKLKVVGNNRKWVEAAGKEVKSSVMP